MMCEAGRFRELVAASSCSRVYRSAGQCLQHLDELIAAIAIPPTELDELLHLRHNDAAFRRTGDGDRPTAAHLQQSLVPQHPQCSQHRVRVDAENGSEVPRLRDTFAWFRLTVCDRPSNLCCDLLVQVVRYKPYLFFRCLSPQADAGNAISVRSNAWFGD